MPTSTILLNTLTEESHEYEDIGRYSSKQGNPPTKPPAAGDVDFTVTACPAYSPTNFKAASDGQDPEQGQRAVYEEVDTKRPESEQGQRSTYENVVKEAAEGQRSEVQNEVPEGKVDGAPVETEYETVNVA